MIRLPPAKRFPFLLGAGFFHAFVRLRVLGREHLPAPNAGGWLLAANHLSHFDPPLLTVAAGRWIDWAAMVELFRGPLANAFWRALAAFPVDRSRVTDRAAARAALERLRAGRVVGIFPERGIRAGEKSVLRGGGEIDPGVCRLALAANVPLIPAAVVGSEALYSPGVWLMPGRRKFRVTVAFGPPLFGTGAGHSGKAAAEELKQRLTAELVRLGRLGSA